MQFTHPDQVTEKAPSGCYVSGLFLEGARWDLKESCLSKSLPKVLIEELPILRVIPIEAHRLKLVVSFYKQLSMRLRLMSCAFTFLQNTLRTPVYTTSNRRNAMGVGLVFEADLATTEHISHWVLQGVCLLLNTD